MPPKPARAGAIVLRLIGFAQSTIILENGLILLHSGYKQHKRLWEIMDSSAGVELEASGLQTLTAVIQCC